MSQISTTVEPVETRQPANQEPSSKHHWAIAVLAVVVVGLSVGKLFVPPERIVPIHPLYVPAHKFLLPPIGHSYYEPAKIETEVDFDRKPFPAEESCAIFEFTEKLPGSVCDAATIAKGKH